MITKQCVTQNKMRLPCASLCFFVSFFLTTFFLTTFDAGGCSGTGTALFASTEDLGVELMMLCYTIPGLYIGCATQKWLAEVNQVTSLYFPQANHSVSPCASIVSVGTPKIASEKIMSLCAISFTNNALC
jgi:hypothetical protein